MAQKAPHLLVTGGGRGIGLALCQAALARGWRVSTTLRTGPAPEGVTSHRLDVRDFAGLPALSAAVGPLDILINNAGIIGPPANARDLTDFTAFQEVLLVNSLAPLAVAQALLPNLRAAGGGARILSISSQMSAMGHAKSDSIAYRASKVALNKVMQGLATDLAPEGIAVALINPGWVRTDMGGPRADLDAGLVASGILNIASGLSMAQTGAFLRYDGTPFAW